VHTKKQVNIGTNVSSYYALGLVQDKEATNYKNMMDRGNSKKTWRSVEHYGK
jgi:hypothetical protein